MPSVLRYAGGLCGVVLALVGAGGRAESAEAVPEGPRLAIVKFSVEPPRLDLQTVDPTGAQPFRLLGGGLRKRPIPYPLMPPAWSPDGSMVAFTGLVGRVEDAPRSVRIFVVGADGRDARIQRGLRRGYAPVFSPDGVTIAFARSKRWAPARSRRDEDAGRGSTSTWLADLRGGQPERITPRRRGLSISPDSFSPDGSTLLLTRRRGARPPEAVAMPARGGKARVLLRRAAEPIFSPDGSRIALLRTTASQRSRIFPKTTDLFTMNADRTGLRRLTRSRSRAELFPRWDPSGERIAFNRFRPPRSELAEIGFGDSLMQVNADGSCLQRTLSLPEAAIYGAAWQPGPGREAGRIEC